MTGDRTASADVAAGLTDTPETLADGPADRSDPDSRPRPGQGGKSVRWSGIAVIGRQLSQMVAALVLARILGPDTYGAISIATVYVAITTLVMDQGLSAAMVQRPRLDPRAPGAVASLNIVAGLVLGGATVALAPLVADFFATASLTGLLRVLGIVLVLKSLAITPRAIRQRRLEFGVTAVADVAGGVLGAAAGITAALLGQGLWSFVWQVATTDLVVAAVLLIMTRGTRPNADLRQVRELLPFSLRVFGSTGIAFFARNADNVLIGRFLGVEALSHYSMAYRVLVIPVQMIGQTVNRVAFPTLARLADRPAELAKTLNRTSEMVATLAIPPMALVAVAAPEVVPLVLGNAWLATVPILSVLAIAGARETSFYVTPALMRATGAGRLILRYELLATAVQLTGIIIGLQFGPLGVAIGLTVAGFALTPVLLLIQRRLATVRIRSQLRILLPAVHVSLWGAAAYLGVRLLTSSALLTVVLGAIAFVLVALAVAALVHRPTLRRVLGSAGGVIGVRRGAHTGSKRTAGKHQGEHP